MLFTRFSAVLILYIPFTSIAQQAVVKWGDFFIQQKTDSAILLKWTTQLEVNSNQFVVERSIDGNTFTKIDSIKSSGNSLSRISYSFIDNDTNLLKLPVKLFYKISAIGMKGETANQLVGSLNHNQLFSLPWNIEAPLYPNPFKSYFRIKFTKTFPYPIKLSILSLVGAIVQEEYIDISQNSLTEVNTLNLPSGSYVIRLQYENAVQFLRAVKN